MQPRKWRAGGLLRFFSTEPGVLYVVTGLLAAAAGAIALKVIECPGTRKVAWDVIKYGSGWVVLIVPRFRWVRQKWAKLVSLVGNTDLVWQVAMTFEGAVTDASVRKVFDQVKTCWPEVGARIIEELGGTLLATVGGVLYRISLIKEPDIAGVDGGHSFAALKVETDQISEGFRSASRRLDRLERFTKAVFSAAGLEATSLRLTKFFTKGPRTVPWPYSAKLLVAEATGEIDIKPDDRSDQRRRLLRLHKDRLEVYVCSMSEMQEVAPLYLSV